MSPETSSPQTTKICPTCGTRLGINASRCSVCGSTLTPAVTASSAKPVSGPRMPEVRLSLPLLFGLVILLLAIGAGTVYAVLQTLNNGEAPIAAAATDTPTPTETGTATPTPTASNTPTLQPTWTALPPVEYKVALGDTCISIAYNFQVSVNSIVILNGLPASCDTLSVGQILQVPQPTPTPSPAPTNTLNPTELAAQECEKIEYDVKEGDALSSIAANYAVSMASVRVYNNLPSDVVYSGQKLIIPLCEQMLETATPTPVPPYAAPNLLLPADGASFNSSDSITLQWASVGELRENEAYAVTIEDVTEGNARKLVDYVKDSKYIIPESFRPTSNTPHVFRWSVLSVRQTGTDKDTGNPIWEPAGAVSAQRVFSWIGTGSPAPTSTPPQTTPP
jgi:LysM repeat protein